MIIGHFLFRLWKACCDYSHLPVSINGRPGHARAGFMIEVFTITPYIFENVVDVMFVLHKIIERQKYAVRVMNEGIL